MENSQFHNNAVFFIEVSKINPNPYQPRQEFDQEKLRDLADSIKMYGVLQPLVVTRKEIATEDGGLTTEYELIAGERRLRASKLAGLREVPALIRAQEDDSRVKLELAIIENLQREDLNPVDRARSFQRLAEEFGLKHIEIAKKVGRSREYVSNTMRLLALPPEMLDALAAGKISEGHTRPLLMLGDRPQEQLVLFKEIMLKKMTVRDAERISRKIAYDKVRKKDRMFNPEIVEMEEEASELLGTRVHIEPKEVGGRIQIDYFNEGDLKNILAFLNGRKEIANMQSDTQDVQPSALSENSTELNESTPFEIETESANSESRPVGSADETSEVSNLNNESADISTGIDSEDKTETDISEEKDEKKDDEDLYSVQNFSI